MGNKQMHAFVTGMVQGVGFRYFVEKKAYPLGITGFVRNLSDGRVEVLAEGDEAVLKQFLEIVKQGPSFSNIVKTDVEWADASGRYYSFNITF